MTLSHELQWRGLINQMTYEQATDLDVEQRTFYLGVDPSSDSMTIGNLAVVMLVKHLIRHGYKAVVLVGGATGMIGDPKDDAERELKNLDEIASNTASIAAQYRQVLEGESFEIVDNYDWFKDIGYLTFLRDIGKHFSMTQLLDREFVQARIGQDGVGISYAEFSYSLIQGYDYLHLYREKGVTLQIGGSDQWGNMVSGTQLIRKLDGGEAHVLTLPLVMNKTTGKKFGKSEDGAIWLDSRKTSVFKFYQFWLNVDDDSVEDYLKVYTTIQPPEYDQLLADFRSNPAGRAAQQYLAYEVTTLVHGRERAENARNITSTLFGDTPFSQLLVEELDMLALEIQVTTASHVTAALVMSGLASSNSEARRLIEGGAVTLNGEKVMADVKLEVPSLLKKGKNSFVLVR